MSERAIETERLARIGVASYNAAMKVRNWHIERPGEPLTLTADDVCALSGCDTGHEGNG